MLCPLAGGIGRGAVKAPCSVSVCNDSIFLRRISALVSRPHSSRASSAVESPGPIAGLALGAARLLVEGKLALYDVEPKTGVGATFFLVLNSFFRWVGGSSSISEVPLYQKKQN